MFLKDQFSFSKSYQSNQQNISSVDRQSLKLLTREQLNDEKLRQEILKFEDERQRQTFDRFTSYGSFITTLVALIGVAITLWKTSEDNKRQHNLDIEQHNLDIEQRKKDREQQERQRTLDIEQRAKDREQQERQRKQDQVEREQKLYENFDKVRHNLSADSLAIQVTASAALMSFLDSNAESLHEQLYYTVISNLKIDHDSTVHRFLIQVFEQAIRLHLQRSLKENERFSSAITLDRANLSRINLSGRLDLSHTNMMKKTRDSPSKLDLAFADLQEANLRDAKLQRVRGFRVNLRKAQLTGADLTEAKLRSAILEQANLRAAYLTAANLKYAQLKNAQLQQAKLQSAHLNHADLRGANFADAHLTDAYFLGAKFDSKAQKSILKAHGWERAHFSPETYLAKKQKEINRQKVKSQTNNLPSKPDLN